MSKEPRQKPVQISVEFHDKLSDLAKAQGRNMKWLIEDALRHKYPVFKESKKIDKAFEEWLLSDALYNEQTEEELKRKRQEILDKLEEDDDSNNQTVKKESSK